VRYAITCNSAEIWTIFLAPFLAYGAIAADPYPVDQHGHDGLPGLALAAEPAERE